MRTSLALVPLILLAGCFGDASAPPGPTTDPGPAVYAWGLGACSYLISFTPVEAAALLPHLPEGFRPLGHEAMGMPDDPRGDALLGVEAFSCKRSTNLDGATLTETPYGSIFTLVEPPAELRDGEAAFHFFKFSVLVADDRSRAVLAEAGVNALGGRTGVARDQTLTARSAYTTARLALERDGTYEITGMEAQELADTSAFLDFWFVEFSQGTHGLVTWKAHAVSEYGYPGFGTLQMPDAGLAREVIGQDPVDTYTFYVHGSFVNGTITLPRVLVP